MSFFWVTAPDGHAWKYESSFEAVVNLRSPWWLRVRLGLPPSPLHEKEAACPILTTSVSGHRESPMIAAGQDSTTTRDVCISPLTNGQCGAALTWEAGNFKCQGCKVPIAPIKAQVSFFWTKAQAVSPKARRHSVMFFHRCGFGNIFCQHVGAALILWGTPWWATLLGTIFSMMPRHTLTLVFARRCPWSVWVPHLTNGSISVFFGRLNLERRMESNLSFQGLLAVFRQHGRDWTHH